MNRAIDRKLEKHAREMLDHATQGELQDLAATIQAVGDETYRQAIGMCVYAAAYVAVDVSGRWPTDADIREIARITAERETMYPLNQDEVRNYLADGALGSGELDKALGGKEAAATLPVLITASLLLRFCPQGKKWYEYLDQIWNSSLAAENLDESALPAVQIRVHREKLLKDRS